jgi:uncharacterized protein YndB with AHSA1/START domain
MKRIKADTPDVSNESAEAETGTSLSEWFTRLDGEGGLERGRKHLATHLLSLQNVDEWWATTIVVEYERARGAVEKDGRPKGYSICSTKTIAAPVVAVYDAWRYAKRLSAWKGAESTVDLREGGTFANAAGDRGTFLRVRDGKDLRFSWDHASFATGSLVDVLFADKGQSKSGVTLNHSRIQSRRDADDLRAGWAVALAALKQVTEGT